MPLEYKSYGCRFKCGFKHTPNWGKVNVHEQICFKNPSNKTCFTCKHSEYYGECCGESDQYGRQISTGDAAYRVCGNGDYLSNYHEELYKNIIDGDRSMLFAKRLYHRALNEDGTLKAYTLYDDLYQCININCEGWESNENK